MNSCVSVVLSLNICCNRKLVAKQSFQRSSSVMELEGAAFTKETHEF